MSYLLDTNACSDVLKRRFGVADRMRVVTPADIHVCAITVAEARAGSLKNTNAAGLRLAWDHFLRPFAERIIPFDREAAEHYGDIRAHLERAGQMIGDRDCMIAAIGRLHGLVIVSADAAFQRVPGMSVESWRTV